jgi:hypothetical protein
MTARYRRTAMTSNPIPIGRLAFAMLTRIDLSEIGRALIIAGVVAAFVTALSIESEYLDPAPNAVAAQAATASVPAAHREPTGVDAPLRGLSPSEVWAADESAHGMRPEAAH